MSNEQYEPSMDIKLGSFEDMKAAGSGFRLLPAGTYRLRIRSWRLKATKTSGLAMITWIFEVIENADEELNGVLLSNNTMIEGDGYGFFASFILALESESVRVGYEGTLSGPDAKAWLDSLIGLPVTADVTTTIYTAPGASEGREQNQIERFYQ